MLHSRPLLCFSSVVNFPLLVYALLVGAVAQKASCFSFNFSTFKTADESDLIATNSYIVYGAIQVTPDVSVGVGGLMPNQSGRALYKRPFRLWSKSKGMTSFNSTFVFLISSTTIQGGDGLAFILTGNSHLPSNSEGQYCLLPNLQSHIG